MARPSTRVGGITYAYRGYQMLSFATLSAFIHLDVWTARGYVDYLSYERMETIFGSVGKAEFGNIVVGGFIGSVAIGADGRPVNAFGPDVNADGAFIGGSPTDEGNDIRERSVVWVIRRSASEDTSSGTLLIYRNLGGSAGYEGAAFDYSTLGAKPVMRDVGYGAGVDYPAAGAPWSTRGSVNGSTFDGAFDKVRIFSDVRIGAHADYMFSGCANLKSADMTLVDTSLTTSAAYMFSGCRNLVSVQNVGVTSTPDTVSGRVSATNLYTGDGAGRTFSGVSFAQNGFMQTSRSVKGMFEGAG